MEGWVTDKGTDGGGIEGCERWLGGNGGSEHCICGIEVEGWVGVVFCCKREDCGGWDSGRMGLDIEFAIFTYEFVILLEYTSLEISNIEVGIVTIGWPICNKVLLKIYTYISGCSRPWLSVLQARFVASKTLLSVTLWQFEGLWALVDAVRCGDGNWSDAAGIFFGLIKYKLKSTYLSRSTRLT